MAIQGTARLSPRGWQSPYSTDSGFSTGPFEHSRTWFRLALRQRKERLEMGLWASPAARSPSATLPAAQGSHPPQEESKPSLSTLRSLLSKRRPAATVDPGWAGSNLLSDPHSPPRHRVYLRFNGKGTDRCPCPANPLGTLQVRLKGASRATLEEQECLTL